MWGIKHTHTACSFTNTSWFGKYDGVQTLPKWGFGICLVLWWNLRFNFYFLKTRTQTTLMSQEKLDKKWFCSTIMLTQMAAISLLTTIAQSRQLCEIAAKADSCTGWLGPIQWSALLHDLPQGDVFGRNVFGTRCRREKQIWGGLPTLVSSVFIDKCNNWGEAKTSATFWMCYNMYKTLRI